MPEAVIWHRFVSTQYSRRPAESLKALSDDQIPFDDLRQLAGSTDKQVRGELYGMTGISTYELVYGIPNAHIINAAFTHTSANGNRFNNRTRGAWYAADSVSTASDEISYHKA